MTTKRERLEAAVAGEKADRLPVALWRHFPVDDQEPLSLAEAIAAFQAEFDFDFVKVTPASSFCTRDWGVEDAWRGATEGTREYTRRAVLVPEGWRELGILDPAEGYLARQLKCLEFLRGMIPAAVPIVQTVFSPLMQAKYLAGEGALFVHMRMEPKAIAAGLETITRSTINFVEAARSRGIAGIFYAVQFASYRQMDRDSYRRFGEAYDQRILEAAGGLWLNVLHLHGEAVMFDLAGSLPAQVINWHDRETPPSLREARGMVEGALCGGLHREASLVLGDPQKVRAEAATAIEATGGRGLILGTGCVVPIIAPRANLKAARDAAVCA